MPSTAAQELSKKFENLNERNKRNQRVTRETQTWEIQQLAKDVRDGVIINGRLNRGQHAVVDDDEALASVWSSDKQSKYIKSLLCGTAPLNFFLRKVEVDGDDETEWKYEIYDGCNRAYAIRNFHNGDIRIQHDGEYYFFEEMPKKTRNIFLKSKAEVRIYSNCSEEIACRVAADMNNGTTMSIGEQLSLMRSHSNPRANLFDKLVDEYPFSVSTLGYRSKGIAMIAQIIMHIEAGERRWKDGIKHPELKRLYESEAPIQNEIAIRATLSKIAQVVSVVENEIKSAPTRTFVYVMAFESAAMLSIRHNVSIDTTTVKKLVDMSSGIARCSPAKLCDTYLDDTTPYSNARKKQRTNGQTAAN